jgi:hypothetical protein
MAIAASKENARLNGVPDIHIFQSDGFKSLDDADIQSFFQIPHIILISVSPSISLRRALTACYGWQLVMDTKRKNGTKTNSLQFSAGCQSKKLTGILFSLLKNAALPMLKNHHVNHAFSFWLLLLVFHLDGTRANDTI